MIHPARHCGCYQLLPTLRKPFKPFRIHPPLDHHREELKAIETLCGLAITRANRLLANGQLLLNNTA